MDPTPRYGSATKTIATLLAAVIVATVSWCSGDATRTAPTPPASEQPRPAPAPGVTPQRDPDVPEVVAAVVEHVSDGDTAIFRLPDGAEVRSRLIGIDAPESTTVHVTPERWGAEASEYAEAALPEGSTVFLEYGPETYDQHGRLLAWVWLERPDSRSEDEVRDKMFNARIVIDGWAENYRNQPQSAYKAMFRGFESEARDAGRGMWSDRP